MNEDDTNLKLKAYRVAYSYDRSGWCVWEQTEQHRLTFSTGPYDSSEDACDMMRSMNEAQGIICPID